MRSSSQQRTTTRRTEAVSYGSSGSAGEIVVKLTVSVDATGSVPIAYPDLVILADANGWRYLAACCRKRAERARKLPAHVGDEHPDPEDHEHLGMCINSKLSDKIDVRLGSLTPYNRAVVFRRFGIAKKNSFRESFVEWCAVLRKLARSRERAAKPYCGASGRGGMRRSRATHGR